MSNQILIGNVIVLIVTFVITFGVTPVLIYKAIKNYKDSKL